MGSGPPNRIPISGDHTLLTGFSGVGAAGAGTELGVDVVTWVDRGAGDAVLDSSRTGCFWLWLVTGGEEGGGADDWEDNFNPAMAAAFVISLNSEISSNELSEQEVGSRLTFPMYPLPSFSWTQTLDSPRGISPRS